MEATCKTGRLYNTSRLPLAGAKEDDMTAVTGDAFDNFGCTTEVRRDDLKGEYVDAIADTIDIACISGVPEGSEMTKMCPRGEEKLKSYVLGGGRAVDEGMGLVMGRNLCS